MLRERYPAGAIYYLADHLLKLPGDGDGARHLHPQRPVLVVSDQRETTGTNAQAADLFPVVWVVPLATSGVERTRFDIPLPAGEGNLPKKCWARVPALQPADKVHLGDYLGLVTQDTLDAVTAQILVFLGLVSLEDSSVVSD